MRTVSPLPASPSPTPVCVCDISNLRFFIIVPVSHSVVKGEGPEKVLDVGIASTVTSHAQTIVYYTADKDCVEITENRNTSLMMQLTSALAKFLDGDELEFLFEEYLKRMH